MTVSPKRNAILLQFVRHFKAHTSWAHKRRAVGFCTVAPNIRGPSVWNVLHATLVASIILRWLLDFLKVTCTRVIHYHAVPDLNIGRSVLHTSLARKTQTLLLKKSGGTATKVSRICCSSSSSVLGFDWQASHVS